MHGLAGAEQRSLPAARLELGEPLTQSLEGGDDVMSPIERHQNIRLDPVGIRPCPFCGAVKPSLMQQDIYNHPFFLVICSSEDGGCAASGPIRPTSTAAIGAWNGRKSQLRAVS